MVSLVCEYLFNLVKTKYGQSVLKSKEKNIFQQGGLVIVYINCHGTPWLGLFLTFVNVWLVSNSWLLDIDIKLCGTLI